LGYAYKIEEGTGALIGLLNIKKALILTTCGSPKEFSLCIDAYKDIWAEKILQFCGIQDVQFKLFYDVINVDNQTRKGYLEEARDLAANI
jgi:putative NADPH-quinone reductase